MKLLLETGVTGQLIAGVLEQEMELNGALPAEAGVTSLHSNQKTAGNILLPQVAM